MGFYVRKSIKAGPFRYNLSKSGVGVSVGVPGFRVGTGPRGNYIRAGKGGVYYRATLGGTRRSPAVALRPARVPPPAVGADVPMEDLTGASAAELVPTDAACERLTDWLVPQIARIVGADGADVRRLLQQGRVFPLLDGLDTVPSHEVLAQQAMPASERALFDRTLPYHRKAPVDPREVASLEPGDLRLRA